MNRFITLLAMLILTQELAAQTPSAAGIAGNLADSLTKKPISTASVTLKHQDKVVRVTKTDSTGHFLLQEVAPGFYILELTSIGYIKRSLSIQLKTSSLHLGTLLLAEETKVLSGVTVTAQKALVEDKGDRLVYNAEADISNAGGTAADVLRKVPNLTVDLNGNVQMRGNGNIKVLVNGRPSTMMARNLADALRQMPASVIKTVEVITSPGARFDAEGAAGVINIITKKGLRGFSGSVNATTGNFNNGLGGNVSLRRKTIGFSLSSALYRGRNINENSAERTTLVNGIPQNILYRSSEADNTGISGYGELSLDYDPDSTNHFNLSANAWGGNYPNGNTALFRLTDPAGRQLASFRNESRFTNPYGNGQVDFGYTKTFKKTDQEFALLTQYSRMPDNYFYDVDRYEGEKITFREKSSNYSRNQEYTVQADYTHPFQFKGKKDTTSLRLEIGSKAIIRDIGSEVRVEQSVNGQEPMQPDPSQTNDFDYMQRVYSGYTSMRFSNQRKWTISAGARLEHTEIEGHFITTGTRLNSQYNNLIPNLTISKGIKKHTLKASYTQRITRPLIWYLNPWVNASDPLNLSTGNPDLEPELNHMTELSHSVSTNKGLSINSALYTRVTTNALEYLIKANSAGIAVSRPENIAHRKNYGMNINISSRPNKNWNLNGGGNINYINIESKALNQQNDGFLWNMNINSTYKLPKEFTIQTNGSISSGWMNLQRTDRLPFYWYGFSVKKALLDKKASLNLNVNNPFNRGLEQRSREIAPTFISESRLFFVNRSFRLTFEWRFGQMNTESGKQGKKIRNDDSGR
jgi:outer membrane receptor protein involved in Fe transport